MKKTIFLIFCLILILNIIFVSGKFHSADELSIVNDVNKILNNQFPVLKYGFIQPMSAALAFKIFSLGPNNPVNYFLINILLTCLSAIVYFKIIYLLTQNKNISSIICLLSFICSSVFIYSNMFFYEIFSLLFISLSFYYCILFIKNNKFSDFIFLCLFMFLNVLNRTDSIFIFIALMIFIFIYKKSSFKTNTIICSFLFLFLSLFFIFYLNYYQTGNFLINIRFLTESFSTPLLIGLYGHLFSFNKSLFLFNPFLIFSIFYFFKFYKEYKSEAILILIFFIPILIIHSKWCNWSGEIGIGPRYFVKIIPLLCLPLIMFFYDDKRKNTKTIIFIFLCITSLIINISCKLIDYNEIAKLIYALSGNNLDRILFSPFLSPVYFIFSFLKNTCFNKEFLDIIILKASFLYNLFFFICLLFSVFIILKLFNFRKFKKYYFFSISIILFILIYIVILLNCSPVKSYYFEKNKFKKINLNTSFIKNLKTDSGNFKINFINKNESNFKLIFYGTGNGIFFLKDKKILDFNNKNNVLVSFSNYFHLKKREYSFDFNYIFYNKKICFIFLYSPYTGFIPVY